MWDRPSRHRLDRRLADGRLRPRHLRAVASAIAARRTRSEPADAAGPGTPEALAKRLAERAAQLEAQPNPELRASLGVLLAYQRLFLEDGEALLRERVAAGRIGALHGALSCASVAVEGGTRVRFGAPAPDAAGDAAADVARLALDLRARGGPHLAEALVAAFALAADDHGVYSVVAFYERDAACELALAETGRDADPSRHARAALATPGGAPLLVAAGGGAASGKSEVAKALAQRLAAPRVVAARVSAALFGAAQSTPVHELWLEPGAAERVYQGVWQRAGAVLASGHSVVLDACLPSAALRREAAALAERHGARFVFVQCAPPGAAVAARLCARGWDAAAAELAARWSPPGADAPGELLRIDTALPRAEWLAALAPVLEKSLAPAAPLP
jgi:hypothetical protein